MAQNIKAIKDAKEKVIGLKQTLRAILQDKVQVIYLANDIEEHMTRKILEACQEKQISLVSTNLSQNEMGKLCQIEVGASVIALIRQ